MRVLFVSYYFPPAAGGGVQRVLKFAKYLPAFGIAVDVLAPDDPQWVDRDGGLEIPPDTTVHRSRYYGPPPGKPRDILHGRRGLDRAFTRLKLQPRRVLVPDLHAGWALSAIPAGKRIVRERAIDVVISTSPPETDHVVGRRISNACGVPWIADMRDSWLNEPGLRTELRSVRLKRAINRRISDRTIGRADAVLTVSEPIARELRGQYPDVPVHTVMNAVDLDDFASLPQVQLPDDRFTIAYTGNFFGRRSPRPFLAAVDELLQRRADLVERLHLLFVGSLKESDREWIAAHPALRAVVEQRAFSSYSDALAIQRAADALYLAIADGAGHEGEVTGKLFEYLGARRPIIAVVPATGAAAELVRDLAAGTVLTPDETYAISIAVERMLDAWLREGRAPDITQGAEAQARISRVDRARQLADIVRDVAAKKRSSGGTTRRPR